MDYQAFIARILKDASEIARQQFGNVKGWAKDGNNRTVLTETDLALSRLIVSSIEAEFPTHNVIDEEAGVIDRGSGFTWVIDPIDGTSNFATGSPLYGIMIGLLERGVPIAGGFALPSFNEIYVAGKGRGATLNDVPIQVTNETNLEKVLVAVGLHEKYEPGAEKLGQLTGSLITKVLNLRSSASTFDTAMVAKGSYGAFLSNGGMIWDCVGPHIVIEEAGGLFTHFDGTTIDYSNALKSVGKPFS